MTNEKRPITAEDLYKFQVIIDAQISPDGEHTVFVVQRVNDKTEKKYTDLWLAKNDGSQTHQFTFGDHSDTMPRWSPDSQTIAFLSNRASEKQMQIYLIPLHGGEARKLTDLTGSVNSMAWSPNGKTLLLSFRKKDEEAIEREKDEQKKKLGVVERHITSVFYTLDGLGYMPQEKTHIHTVDVATGEATQLTDGDKNENSPSWSPDGNTIIFASNRHDNPDLNPDATEIYTIPAMGGDMVQLETNHDKQKSQPKYSPDGKWVAYLGRRFSGRYYQNQALYLMPASGGTATNITQKFDLHISSVTINDIGGYPPPSPFTWSADSQTIYIQVTHRGNQPIIAINLGDEITSEPLLNEKGVYGAFTLNQDGTKASYFYADIIDPGQVYTKQLTNQQTSKLTNLNSWLGDIQFDPITDSTLTRPDAPDLPLWVFYPPNFDTNKTYPSILNVHGGPQTQYGNFFLHEAMYWATQGYVVYGTNPRGSQGYGEAYAGAIHNDWGTVDFDDVMFVTDHMEAQPYIDAKRMGVTGGSYGGWMTTTIIGRTQRFKAAAAQRVVSNWISMWGSSDLTWQTGELFGGGAPWESLEDYIRQSPIFHVHTATTPTLVLHSQGDMRTPQEQGEQLFVSLKRLGIDTELILFPEESHGLSRVGRTDRRIARLNHILRWMDKYLKEGG